MSSSSSSSNVAELVARFYFEKMLAKGVLDRAALDELRAILAQVDIERPDLVRNDNEAILFHMKRLADEYVRLSRNQTFSQQRHGGGDGDGNSGNNAAAAKRRKKKHRTSIYAR